MPRGIDTNQRAPTTMAEDDSDKSQPVYKTWDDGFLVRRMTQDDAKLAQKWFSGICPTSCDLKVALEANLHEHGFYVGEYRGEVVASAVRVPICDGVFYGSYYYVTEPHRRKGFGRRLRDDVARRHVGENVLAIDAHDNLLAMNVRHGYTEYFRVSRYTGSARQEWDCGVNTAIIQISAGDFERLIEFDNECFVKPNSAQRRSLLRHWLQITGSSCIAAVNEGGALIGYGCRRPALEGNNHIIGPLYANTYNAAYSVVRELCSAIPEGGEIMFDICLNHKEAVRLVAALDMKEALTMIRMCLNGDPGHMNPRVYGLTSIDVCGF